MQQPRLGDNKHSLSAEQSLQDILASSKVETLAPAGLYDRRSRDIRDVNITRAMVAAHDCWTDHRLIRSMMCLQIAPRHRQKAKQAPKRYNMTRLRSDEALNHFNRALDEKVGPVDVESPVIETAWNSLQEAINVACKESIGHARRVNLSLIHISEPTRPY